MGNTGIAPDVYFPIEIVSREYAGHVLLATELAARGRVAVIGHKGAVARTMTGASRGGLLFYKNAQVPTWADRRHVMVGQDPEAGVSFADYRDFYVSGRTNLSNSPTRAQFCFGPEEYEVLRAEHPELTDRIFLTGSPRVSLWGSDGIEYHAHRVTAIAKRYGAFVLFASAAGGFAHEERLKDPAHPDGEWAAATSARHFFAAAKHAAKALDVPVILRPHPGESWRAWHDLVAPVDNLYLESAFELSAWTRGALAVVHPGESTAAVEAVVAGTPAVSTGSYPSTIALPISHISQSAEHLVQLLHEAAANRLSPSVSTESDATLRRKLHHPVEGAAQRIADVLDQVTPPSGTSGLERTTTPRQGRIFARSRRFRPSFETELGRSTPPPYKRPNISLNQIRDDVSAASRILGRTGIIAEQHAKNCFILRIA